MPRGKRTKPVDTAEQAPDVSSDATPNNVDVTQPAPVVAQDGDKVSFEVVKDGASVRIYTVEVHGEDAGQLANQFAVKIGGTVR